MEKKYIISFCIFLLLGYFIFNTYWVGKSEKETAEKRLGQKLQANDFVYATTRVFSDGTLVKIQSLNDNDWNGIIDGDIMEVFKYDQIKKVYDKNKSEEYGTCFDPRSPICPSSPMYEGSFDNINPENDIYIENKDEDDYADILENSTLSDRDKLIFDRVHKRLNGHIDSSGERTRRLYAEEEQQLADLENEAFKFSKSTGF